jgi:hypothetical protein
MGIFSRWAQQPRELSTIFAQPLVQASGAQEVSGKSSCCPYRTCLGSKSNLAKKARLVSMARHMRGHTQVRRPTPPLQIHFGTKPGHLEETSQTISLIDGQLWSVGIPPQRITFQRDFHEVCNREIRRYQYQAVYRKSAEEPTPKIMELVIARE